MSFGQFLLAVWQPRPPVMLGIGLLLVAYLVGARPHTRRVVPFCLALLCLLIALASPLEALAEGYLFSAHMLQHMLLLLAPPLLLLGLPSAWVRAVLRLPAIGPVVRALTHPAVAWPLATLTLLGWHVPGAYQAALRSLPLHQAEHLSFLATAGLFWWPVVSPDGGEFTPALAPWSAVLYLFAAMIAGSVLGIILALSDGVFYPIYEQLPDPHGMRPTLRGEWGLTASGDQQLGGALMWIIGGLPYMAAIVIVIARWFGSPEDEDERLPGGAVSL
jgi:cytochrome c oxidase assembly factor CtaG